MRNKMAKIKIKAIDKWFSKCVRERAGWACERCGAQHDSSSTGLHCSHYHGRGKWSTRVDPENCEALCYGCHSYMGANPSEHRQRIIDKLGAHRFEALQERANDTSRGRQAKKLEKEACKHFRDQYREMEFKRVNGHEGRLEFDGYF